MKKINYLLILVAFVIFSCTDKQSKTYSTPPPSPFSVELKVKLDDVSVTDNMSNYYQTANLLPLTTPYLNRLVNDVDTVRIDSTCAKLGNNAIVDWILIELRSDSAGVKVVRQTRSGLLQRDGDVVSLDGISPIKFNVPNDNYWISLKHRNHLGIRTLNSYWSSTSLSLNFTNNSIPLAGNFNVSLKNGYSVLISGDANGDGSIDAYDSALFEAQNGLFDDYSKGADYNLDGSVDAFDTILWESENGMYETVE